AAVFGVEAEPVAPETSAGHGSAHEDVVLSGGRVRFELEVWHAVNNVGVRAGIELHDRRRFDAIETDLNHEGGVLHLAAAYLRRVPDHFAPGNGLSGGADTERESQDRTSRHIAGSTR